MIRHLEILSVNRQSSRKAKYAASSLRSAEGTGDRPPARREENAHYQIHAVADNTDYRLAVNVSSSISPPDLLYLIDTQFPASGSRQIVDLEYGWHPMESRPEVQPSITSGRVSSTRKT